MVSLTNNAGKVNIDSGQQNELNKGVLSLQGKMLSDGPLKVGAASKLRDIIICVDQKDLPPSALLKVSFRGQSHYFSVTEPNAIIQISLTEGVDCESIDKDNKMHSARFFASGATPVTPMREARNGDAKPPTAPRSTPKAPPTAHPSTSTTDAKPAAPKKSAPATHTPSEKSPPKTATNPADIPGHPAAAGSTKTRIGQSKPSNVARENAVAQKRELPEIKKQEQPGKSGKIGTEKKSGMDASASTQPRQAPVGNGSSGTPENRSSLPPNPAPPLKTKAKSESVLPATKKRDNAPLQAPTAQQPSKSQSEAALGSRQPSVTSHQQRQERQPAIPSPPQNYKLTAEEQELLAELDAQHQKATGSFDLKSLEQEVDREIEDSKSDIQRFLESERPRKPPASRRFQTINQQVPHYKTAINSLQDWCQKGCEHLKKVPEGKEKVSLLRDLIGVTANWTTSLQKNRSNLERAFRHERTPEGLKPSLREGAKQYSEMASTVVALQREIVNSANASKTNQAAEPSKVTWRIPNLFRRS